MVGAKKHQEAAQLHNAFFWKFVEHVSGKTHDYFIREYMLSSNECAIEELEANHKLVLLPGEGWFTYFLPKGDTELTEWFKENCKHIPNKVLKRKNIVFEFHEPEYWWKRDHFRTPDNLRKKYFDVKETEVRPEEA